MVETKYFSQDNCLTVIYLLKEQLYVTKMRDVLELLDM